MVSVIKIYETILVDIIVYY